MQTAGLEVGAGLVKRPEAGSRSLEVVSQPAESRVGAEKLTSVEEEPMVHVASPYSMTWGGEANTGREFGSMALTASVPE